jgi:NitT/TauT family transport system substrate-binding protein
MRNAHRRLLVYVLAAAAFAGIIGPQPATAQTPLKLVLPWDFESGTAPWPVAASTGCFSRNGLNVTIDRGFGSGDALTKVASGAYEIGVADIGTMINFDAQHPEQKLIATFITNDRSPMSIVALKKSGITKPADLTGKKIGDAVGEASRLMWPAFAKANGLRVDGVTWASVTTNLREPALLRGEFDAAAGDSYTIVVALHRLGVKDSDIVVMPFTSHGVDVVGRAVITKSAWANGHSDILKKFLLCTAAGMRQSVVAPVAAVAAVRKYNALMDNEYGIEALQYLNRVAVATPSVMKTGVGDVDPARLAHTVAVVSEVFGIARPPVSQVWTSAYLPPFKDRNLATK